jgi:hypothetical protein
MPTQAQVTAAIEKIEEVGNVIDGWGDYFLTYGDYANALKFQRGVIKKSMYVIKNYIHDLEMG